MTKVFIGIDKGGDDCSALSIMVGEQVFIIPDPFASVLIAEFAKLEKAREALEWIARYGAMYPKDPDRLQAKAKQTLKEIGE